MDFNLWLAYISVISLLIFSPGPSAVLCLNHGVKYGAVKSLPTITGGCVAALFLMSLSAFGLGVLLLASAKTFLLVKLLGAVYLVYLGVGMWREGAKGVSLTPDGTVTQPLPAVANFKTGFLVGISNPKDIIFFAALFPNFISFDHPQTLQFMILALTWCVVDFSGMFFYSSVGLKVAPWFESTKNMLRFNRFLGGFFVTAGSLLAMSNKKL